MAEKTQSFDNPELQAALMECLEASQKAKEHMQRLAQMLQKNANELENLVASLRQIEESVYKSILESEEQSIVSPTFH